MNRIGDLKEYLDTFGNLSRSEKPYGEVDYMILATMVYCPFETLMGEDRGKTLGELRDIVWSRDYQDNMGKDREDLWFALSDKPRFASLRLDMFVSITDKKTEEQFAAAVFSDGTDAFLVFRGTDRTTVGWKEDFNLSYCDEIPSERHAAKMLEGIASFYSSVEVIGHSKGGILAVYSAYMVSSVAFSRIKAIWSFDGPGLPSSFMGGGRWDKVSKLTHAYIPESSVIGILFNSLAEPSIVKSRSIGVLQHNPVTWRIEGDQLLRTEDTSVSSKLTALAVKNILEGSTPEERENLVNTVYGIVDAAGYNMVTELPKGALAHREELKKTIEEMPQKTKEAMEGLMKALWNGRKEGINTIARSLGLAEKE